MQVNVPAKIGFQVRIVPVGHGRSTLDHPPALPLSVVVVWIAGGGGGQNEGRAGRGGRGGRVWGPRALRLLHKNKHRL